MAIKRMPIGQFMTEVHTALNRKDGKTWVSDIDGNLWEPECTDG